ncbi:MAG TPA: lytic murein transglycosylase [Candidatus Paceibacterota bacterium]|jgi:peptidoglycan hydrolase CwlO-like protein
MLFARRQPILALLAIGAAVLLLAAYVPYSQAQTDDIGARRAELQRQLNEVEAQINQTNAVIGKLQGEGSSLQRDINVLDEQIRQTRLQIRATDIAIQALSENITLHGSAISSLSGKLTEQQQALAEIIRRTQQYDDYSLVEVVLSTKNVSDFFGDLDSFATLKSAIGDSSKELAQTRAATEVEKDGLETQRNQQHQLRELRVLEEEKVKSQEAQKARLLAQNRAQQGQVQGTKAELERSAAQIRQALFALAGGGGAIPFGTAYEHAKTASRITGVRPAMILAILSQESDLGRNVGQCLVTSLTTGDGKGKNTGTFFSGVMKVPRDTVPFERVVTALGRDWSTTAVSCPQPGGYGGAMGPTQFIPSTWVMYEGRIKSSLGVAASDPWNSLHAIVATGLYLSDVGASGGSYQAEHTAAAKYYAGGNWAVAGQAYANSVMGKAAAFQADINTLEGR